MSVGEHTFPEMPSVAGIRLAVGAAQIKYQDRNDLLLVELAEGATVAAVFTQNAFAAAPVLLGRQHLAASKGNIRYLLINSGNANACTGEPGLEDAKTLCQQLADRAGVAVEQVLPFSTGVVGERLPVAKVSAATERAFEQLGKASWLDAEQAIMTTDTRPKGVRKTLSIDGQSVELVGIAKGSGTIKPNMATMLAYVATDAAVEHSVLQGMLERANNRSFNRIVIDGDTSTNDALVVMASGNSGVRIGDDASGFTYQAFYQALQDLCQQLACEVVRDGEGATKFVAVQVDSAADSSEALTVAYAIAQSPLVKTALFASDPNWGRIAVAIGYAGVTGLDPNRVNIFLDDVCIVRNGGRAESYEEAQGQKVMDQDSLAIRVELHRGESSEVVWTTDFSHDYVTINAEYRT